MIYFTLPSQGNIFIEILQNATAQENFLMVNNRYLSKRTFNFCFKAFALFLQPHYKKGPVTEWLGRALQKLPQRFESARDL